MNLSDWAGSFNLRKALEKDLGVPVALGNDVDLATSTPSSRSAPRARSTRCSACSGAPASAAA